MSFHHRPYYGSGGGGGFGAAFGGRLAGATAVKWIMGINGVVFLLDAVLKHSARGSFLSPWSLGHFSVERAIYGLQFWRFVTYQFLHHGFMHILFNMIGLYFFGPMMEQWWGSKRFVWFYIICGLGGAIVYTAMTILVPDVVLVGRQSSLVGASGCLFGILVGCAVLYPHQRVMLMIPPIPMSMRTMALGFIGLAMLSLIAGSPNAGGEAAHLGGAAVGFLLVMKPGLLSFADRPWLEGWQRAKAERDLKRRRQEQEQVDQILDKVRDKGLASLTDREKKILQRATDQKRRAG